MDGRKHISCLLPFDDVWLNCFTKPFDFVKALKHNELEELESLRVLTAMRADALENRNLADALESQIEKLETYLFHLSDLRSKSDTYWTKKTDNQLRFQWTSPLGGRTDYLQIRGIELEIAMVMFLYGCALRERVHASAAEMKDADGDRSVAALEAVKALRETAGVFKYIHTILTDITSESLESQPNTPVECIPITSACWEKLCLGEAQSMVAFRALEKGTSSAVLTALHVGASDLFEEASSILKENTGKFNAVSDRLRRCIALDSSLHTIRGYQQQAAAVLGNGQAGHSITYCQKALNLLETCVIVAETDERWTTVMSEEKTFVESLENVYDQERITVFLQQVADYVAPLPEGKVLVSSTDYAPKEMQPFL